jgi:hypothetical protein
LTVKVAPYRKDKCTPSTFFVVHDNSAVRNQRIGYLMKTPYRQR